MAWDKSYVGKFTVEEAENIRGGKLTFKSAYLLTKLSVTKEQDRLLNVGLLCLKTT
jgi:hypothetical protein